MAGSATKAEISGKEDASLVELTESRSLNLVRLAVLSSKAGSPVRFSKGKKPWNGNSRFEPCKYSFGLWWRLLAVNELLNNGAGPDTALPLPF